MRVCPRFSDQPLEAMFGSARRRHGRPGARRLFAARVGDAVGETGTRDWLISPLLTKRVSLAGEVQSGLSSADGGRVLDRDTGPAWGDGAGQPTSPRGPVCIGNKQAEATCAAQWCGGN